MSRLDELKKALAELEDKQRGLRAGIEFVQRHAPNLGISERAFYAARENITREIKKEEELLLSHVDKANKAYREAARSKTDDIDCQRAAEYILLLERCRPWAIKTYGCSILMRDAHVALFATNDEARAYAVRHIGSSIQFEIFQWEGRQ
jgi:transposase